MIEILDDHPRVVEHAAVVEDERWNCAERILLAQEVVWISGVRSDDFNGAVEAEHGRRNPHLADEWLRRRRAQDHVIFQSIEGRFSRMARDFARSLAFCSCFGNLWSACARLSRKSFVPDFIRKNTTFCLTEFYFSRPYSWLVTPIGRSAGNGNEILAFDLANDPAEVGTFTDTELALRLGSSPKPIRAFK